MLKLFMPGLRQRRIPRVGLSRCISTQESFKSEAVTKNTNDLSLLKFDSNGSNNLYAIFKLYNIPYLVTKGDKVVLPYKLKNAEAGDKLIVNNVTTIGSPNFTYSDNKGIKQDFYELTAKVIEITKEPYYEVYRTKPRCRRVKTFGVQPYQTILMISELKLK